MCAHRTPAYAEIPWSCGGSLVESERAEDRSVMLPLYPGLSEEDQVRVIGALIDALRFRESQMPPERKVEIVGP
jgi:dTDP-4-amino-4,6-dideoxygalactose transaminase